MMDLLKDLGIKARRQRMEEDAQFLFDRGYSMYRVSEVLAGKYGILRPAANKISYSIWLSRLRECGV